jgi:hypothetical protein
MTAISRSWARTITLGGAFVTVLYCVNRHRRHALRAIEHELFRALFYNCPSAFGQKAVVLSLSDGTIWKQVHLFLKRIAIGYSVIYGVATSE